MKVHGHCIGDLQRSEALWIPNNPTLTTAIEMCLPNLRARTLQVLNLFDNTDFVLRSIAEIDTQFAIHPYEHEHRVHHGPHEDHRDSELWDRNELG